MPEQRRLGLLEALLVVQAHMMRLGAEITLRKAMEPDDAVRHANRDYLWALAGYDALGDIESELIVATRPEGATIH